MQLPLFLRETIVRAKTDPVWGFALLATLLIPWMMIFARVGIEICGAIIGLSFLWVSFRQRDWAWLRQPFTLACILAWAWLSLVVTPLAIDPAASVTPSVLWFRMPLMAIALRYYVLRSPAARSTLALMLAVMLAAVGVDALWQYATGMSFTGHARLDSGRLTGPFAAPKVGLYLGKMLLPAIALGLVHALTHRSRAGIAAVLGLLFGTMVVILLTGERSALLGTVLGLTVAAGLMMLAERRWRAPCMAVALATVALLALLYSSNDWVRLRGDQAVQTMQHYAESDYGVLIGAAYTIGRQHLAHGVGLGGFRELCPDLHYNGYVFRGMHPHNAFAEWFAEAGLPGLLLFLAIIAVLLRDGVQHFRTARGIERLLPAMALGITAQHFFPLMGMQSFFTNWPAMLVWYPLGLAFAGLPKERDA